MQLIRLLRAQFLRQRKTQIQPPDVEDIPRFLLRTGGRRTPTNAYCALRQIVYVSFFSSVVIAQTLAYSSLGDVQLAYQFASYIRHNQCRCRFSNLNSCRLISTY
jgi:hypothetical protein